MRRASIAFLAMLLTVLTISQALGQTAPKAEDKELQTTRLRTIYKAYQSYEVSKGKPANRIDELDLAPADVKELKGRFSFDEFGVSLAQAEKDDLPKMVMVYEKLAPKDGGLVLFYDGSVKTLTAKEVKNLLGMK